MRISRATFYIALLFALPLYVMFIVLPFQSGQCLGWIHWCLNTSGSVDSLVGQPVEMLLPLITWTALVILRRRQVPRQTFLFDIAIWISLGSLILVGLTGWYFFWSGTASGVFVSNGGTNGQGTIDYANNVVDNAIRAFLSGALLGVLVSMATPYLSSLTVRSFLWFENNLMRHPPPKTMISALPASTRSDLQQEFTLLFRRSLFFGITLGLVYSELGFEAVFPPQGSKGMPVIELGFVAIFFFSTIIPAMVHFLERNTYVIKYEGRADEFFSEGVMKWVGIATSLTVIISLIVSLKSLDQFVRNPISFLFALLTFMAAPFAMVGSCLSIVAFPAKFSRRQKKSASLLSIIAILVILAYPFVVLYPKDLLEWLVVQNVAAQTRCWVSQTSEFAYGTTSPFGFYYYPIALLAGVLGLIGLVTKGYVKRVSDMIKVTIAASAGMALALVPYFLFKHNSPWHLWIFVIQILTLTVPVIAGIRVKTRR